MDQFVEKYYVKKVEKNSNQVHEFLRLKQVFYIFIKFIHN